MVFDFIVLQAIFKQSVLGIRPDSNNSFEFQFFFHNLQFLHMYIIRA